MRARIYEYIKNIVPTWPEYVVRDWLYHRWGRDYNNKIDACKKNILGGLEIQGLRPDTKWRLIADVKFTMDKFSPDTQKAIIGRHDGLINLLNVARDKERHELQAMFALKEGGVRSEPVIITTTSNGYNLIAGWHRTIQHFRFYPDGFIGPAYIAESTK